MKHQVVVGGNVGTVYAGEDEVEALAVFGEYMVLSMSGQGREGNQTVVYLTDGKVEEVHDPNDDAQAVKLEWVPGHEPEKRP